ncbi:MAG: hypothetical protein JXB30_01650 [Anaerolineae bacterium]|nr:hypothetical protein [Anaerolineae bacterium]
MKVGFSTLKQHIANVGPRFLSAGEQTMRSWAEHLHSLDEVPEIYREFFAGLSPEPGKFPYTVLTPSYEGFFVRANPKLICLVEPDIYVIEHRRKEMEVKCFPFADINYIEAGSVLLKSWIKISGITSTGLSAASFQFSVVTRPFFDPFIERARVIEPPFASDDLEAEQDKFLHLREDHLKFMNYARRSILPGEKIIADLMQPEIRLKILKAFYHTVTPAHISILTDRELILITEDNERLTRTGAPYGGIWYYIPLRRITVASLTERSGHTLTLSIQMPEDDEVSSIFGTANRAEAEALVGKINELVGGR